MLNTADFFSCDLGSRKVVSLSLSPSLPLGGPLPRYHSTLCPQETAHLPARCRSASYPKCPATWSAPAWRAPSPPPLPCPLIQRFPHPLFQHSSPPSLVPSLTDVLPVMVRWAPHSRTRCTLEHRASLAPHPRLAPWSREWKPARASSSPASLPAIRYLTPDVSHAITVTNPLESPPCPRPIPSSLPALTPPISHPSSASRHTGADTLGQVLQDSDEA